LRVVYVHKTRVSIGKAQASAGLIPALDPQEYSWYTFNGSMDSEGHQWPPPPKYRGDVGGPWVQSYESDRRNSVTVNLPKPGLNRQYFGQAVLGSWPQVLSVTTPTPLTDSAMKAFGTTAIARTEPTAEYFSGATALGELISDGLPGGASLSLMRNRVSLARSAGKNYLNAEFGWLPLVSDVKTLCRAVRRSDEIMSAYLKGSEKRIRSRYVQPTVTASGSASGNCTLVPNFNSLPGTYRGTTHRQSETSTWFSGAFRYHIPATAATSGISRAALIARKVYGIELTPEVVWNLAPWSWASDWFGNVGDVMHNVSALGRDGLVIEYGYVMSGRKIVEDTFCSTPYGGLTREYALISRKRMPKVSPYGFGVSWSGLSSKQLAVVAALGLTRAPF